MTHALRAIPAARVLIAAFIAAVLLVAMPVAKADEDPATLAVTYAKQAADLRAIAEKHLATAKLHKGATGKSAQQHDKIAKHCEALAKNLQDAATESDALAETYRGLARDY